MPIAPIVDLQSPPTNCFGLYQYLAQRLPGYDPSEYLREINSAYIHVWEEVSKLKNQYFTKTKMVTVLNGQFEYDLINNADGALSSALSNRLYQLTRVRVLPPVGGLIQTSVAMHPNDIDFLSISANLTSPPTGTGPYYYYLTGWGSIRFGLPIQQGSKIEFVYTYWPLALKYLTDGSVSSSSSTVTGAGTAFTQLVQPDFASNLPAASSVDTEQLQAELVCNTGQVYRVTSITSDTQLTTAVPVAPVLSPGSIYAVAAVPEIPREHIRVIGSMAMAKMYDVAGDDARVQEWMAIAASNMQMMKDSLIERQGQNPPKRGRFPYGIARRNRAFLR